MPDAFFASTKPRKRKRLTNDSSGGPSKKVARKADPSGARHSKKRVADEELDSDRTNDEEWMGVGDVDLRVSDGEEGSGSEVENETPAEKRLRLAKLYLESVKEDLGEWRSLSF